MSPIASRLRSILANPSNKRFGILASLLLVFAGERCIRACEPFAKSTSSFDAVNLWNRKLYLGLDKLLNILIGFILIVTGAVLFGRFMGSSGWTQVEQISFQNKRLEISWKPMLPWLVSILVVFSIVMVELSHHQYSTLLLTAWLAALIGLTVILWLHENKAGTNLDPDIARVDLIWILSLFGFAVGAGSFLLNDLPAGWIADEGPFFIRPERQFAPLTALQDLGDRADQHILRRIRLWRRTSQSGHHI